MKRTKEEFEKAIRYIINYIGDDPDRPGLKETPHRVHELYTDILMGYTKDIQDCVKTFKESDKDMVIIKDIPFYSFCEHHMLPFIGTLKIAYIPVKGQIIGLSKLIRIARIFAKRLQVQERLTAQIANAISKHVPNKGVAVRIEAEHMCMSIRGIRTPGAKTITTRLTGMFFNDVKTRKEFLDA